MGKCAKSAISPMGIGEHSTMVCKVPPGNEKNAEESHHLEITLTTCARRHLPLSHKERLFTGVHNVSDFLSLHRISIVIIFNHYESLFNRSRFSGDSPRYFYGSEVSDFLGDGTNL
jgi:hypothetical protein